MDVTVIICTFNRAASLKMTLASLQQLQVPPSLRWELLLVDNNSSDTTRDVIDQFAASSGWNVRHLFERQQGRSFALNAAISEAEGEILIFTDDDVTFDPKWLVTLNEAFAGTDCIGAGGKIVPVWSDPQPSWFQMEGQQVVGHLFGDEPRDLNYAMGANSAFRREAFQKYGVFKAGVSVNGKLVAGYEDDEFGHRLIGAGEMIRYVPGAIVYHPVLPHRLTKAFFRKWFFDTGRAMVWTRIWPPATVCYFGIPRFLFRALCENSLKWPLTRDEKRRFHRECQACRAAGGILEGCNELWQKLRTGRSTGL